MFDTPFTCIISGATGTGKTQWLMRFLKNANEIMSTPPKHVLYCYSEINHDIIKLKNEGVEVFNGIPTKDVILSKPKGTLLILDDLMNEIEEDYLNILFTRGSHHWDLSVIVVTQNLYEKKIKTARINSHYIILMKNPQGLLQIKTLASQLFSGRVNYFMEAYNDAVENRNFGYLLINLSPKSDPEYRLCTNIFPSEKTIIYLPI